MESKKETPGPTQPHANTWYVACMAPGGGKGCNSAHYLLPPGHNSPEGMDQFSGPSGKSARSSE